jgi:hypothetical protein
MDQVDKEVMDQVDKDQVDLGHSDHLDHPDLEVFQSISTSGVAQEVMDQVDLAVMVHLDRVAQEALEVLSLWEFPSTLVLVILCSFHLLEASLLFPEAPSPQTKFNHIHSMLPSMEQLTLQQA